LSGLALSSFLSREKRLHAIHKTETAAPECCIITKVKHEWYLSLHNGEAFSKGWFNTDGFYSNIFSALLSIFIEKPFILAGVKVAIVVVKFRSILRRTVHCIVVSVKIIPLKDFTLNRFFLDS
jgi:hypothetical protein